MNRIRFVSICQYQLYREWQMTVILLIILLANFTLGAVLKSKGSSGGTIDLITLIFALIIGYTLFSDTFRFAVYNGITRKTYLCATCATALLLSAIWSFLTSGIVVLAENYTSSHLLFPSIYSDGFGAMFLWFFAVILFLLIFSWFAGMLMASLPKRVKRIVLLVIGVLIPTLVLVDGYTEGAILSAIIKTKLLLLGVNGNTASPYLSAVILALLSIFFIGLAWVSLRKIEV